MRNYRKRVSAVEVRTPVIRQNGRLEPPTDLQEKGAKRSRLVEVKCFLFEGICYLSLNLSVSFVEYLDHSKNTLKTSPKSFFNFDTKLNLEELPILKDPFE